MIFGLFGPVLFANIKLSNNTGYAIGGQVAKPNSIPWQVGLVKTGEDNPDCGGTIICTKFVMTAAHCVKSVSICNTNPMNCQVLVGEHDLSNSDDDATRHNIKEFHVHPNYQ